MDLYIVSLATGAVGLGVMAVGGLSHGGHAHAGHGHGGDAGLGHAAHGHAGHAGDVGHVGHSAQAGHAHGSHAGHNGHDSHATQPGWSWMSLLSPRLLFTLMVGFGAGGVGATQLGEPFRFGAALAAAAVFELFFIGPVWRFLFRFESRPALTLESAIEDEARAVTGFDANGCGLVAVDVDGQVIQLLATLAPDDLSRGVRIRRGDMVRISDINAARGRCTVTEVLR